MSMTKAGKWLACVAVALAGHGCGDEARAPAEPEPTLTLDVENRLDGQLGGQGLGRFSVLDGTPDPDGSDYDLQSAQVVTSRLTGVLADIRLPIRNPLGATAPVDLQLRLLRDGREPEPDDGLVIGTASLPAAAFVGVDLTDPGTWPRFDVSGVGLQLTPGRKYCFSVSTVDTLGFVYVVEFTMNYADGGAFRRNRAQTSAWSTMADADFAFQTFVAEP